MSELPHVFERLGLAADGARSLDAWFGGDGEFGLDRGVPVFASQHEVEALDEYSDGDPYGQSNEVGELNEFSRWRLETTTALLERHLPPGGVVLDVGCGPGQLTVEMARRFPTTDFVGVDGSLAAVRAVRDGPTNAAFAVGDASKLPFTHGSFDAVVMNNLWEHLIAPVSVAASLRQLLKPEGFLLLSTPSRYSTTNLLRALAGRPMHLRSKQHVTEYTVGQVKEQLAFVGFQTTEVVGEKFPVRALRERVRRVLFGSVLDSWKQLSGSHHSFAPTVFVVAHCSDG